jgi:GH43 family beta-xylosidase
MAGLRRRIMTLRRPAPAPVLLALAGAALACGGPAGETPQPTPETFTNPLLPRGADPWVIHHEGLYYYTHTLGDEIGLWRTRDITRLADAEFKTVFVPPEGTPYSKQLWAPEIMHLEGKWYIYVAADDGDNVNHRLYVLENAASDPFEGEFVMKGKLQTDPDDNWAIDGSVFRHRGDHYLIWSGWAERRRSLRGLRGPELV